MEEKQEKQEMERMEKMQDKVTKQVTEKINKIVEEGVSPENLDALGKLIDIHKDLANEDYWKIKEEVYKMRYDDYNDYGRRGVPGTGRGYGRRGVPGSGRGRYRGENPMEEMMEHYEEYNDASYEMNRGNYGAENEMVKSVESIMKNICEIVDELSVADSPEVMQVIKKYTKKINEMV